MDRQSLLQLDADIQSAQAMVSSVKRNPNAPNIGDKLDSIRATVQTFLAQPQGNPQGPRRAGKP